ncbi:MAG TPA: hypothetical protein VGQ93_16180, partial [Lysobacter sp.]|nr:hypothetical protein [Lysobacter sp.]
RLFATEELLLRSAVSLESLLDVLTKLRDVHLSGFRRVLELLQCDVLRIAVISFRLVATTGDTHSEHPPYRLAGKTRSR